MSREQDIACAKILGYTVKQTHTQHGPWMHHLVSPHGYIDDSLWYMADSAWDQSPAYSSDLNAVVELEHHLADHTLHEAYIHALIDVIFSGTVPARDTTYEFYVVTATAEQRVAAFLLVAERLKEGAEA